MIREFLDIPADWTVNELCFLGESTVIGCFRHVSGTKVRVIPYWSDEEPPSSHRVLIRKPTGEVEQFAKGWTTCTVEKACFAATEVMEEYSKW